MIKVMDQFDMGDRGPQSWDPDAWVEQELAKVTAENANERYSSYARDYGIFKEEHHLKLLDAISAKFPHKAPEKNDG